MLKKQRHSFQDTYNTHSCTSENLAKQTGRLEFFGRRPAEIEIIEMKMMKQNFILRSFNSRSCRISQDNEFFHPSLFKLGLEIVIFQLVVSRVK